MSRGCAERDAVRDEARNDRERQARSLEQPLACEGRGRFVCGQGGAREMDEAGSHPPLPPGLDEVNVARRRAGSRGRAALRGEATEPMLWLDDLALWDGALPAALVRIDCTREMRHALLNEMAARALGRPADGVSILHRPGRGPIVTS